MYKNFIVYTNRVLESPNEDSDVITHVGKNEIKVLEHRNLINSKLIKNNWVNLSFSKVTEVFIEASDSKRAQGSNPQGTESKGLYKNYFPL